jgi:hypothetical protein
MKSAIRLMAVATGLLAVQVAAAQAPAGSTGQCKDGTYTTAASKQGACRGHQGVKEWYAAAPAASTPAPAAKAPATTPAPAAAPAPAAKTPAPAPAQTPVPAATSAPVAKSSPQAKAAAMPQAAGGGPGLVWVNTNTSSNVYHCYGSDYYGKTKAGAYMSEADAKAKGARPDHGKPCAK